MPAESSRAVFLSYASQDAEAARKICESLREGGVEVWFDADGGLEHGDEWDAKIRRQIKECVLFIPIISANTQAREEGYFRLEWDLAAERARTIASGVPFILPVAIDDTREPDALVPDRFRAVQWTRLRGGEVTPEVRARFLKLWSHRTGVLKQQELEPGRPRPAERDPTSPSLRRAGEGVASPAKPKPTRPWLVSTIVAGAAAVALAFWQPWKNSARTPPVPEKSAPVPVASPTPDSAPLSEARRIARRAQALADAVDGLREDLHLAEELIAQAKAKDATDAEVCAIEAQIHERFIQRGWDDSDARREAAQVAVQRAIRLDPQSFEARYAQAFLLGTTGREGEERERQLRTLRRERPKDQRILRALATTLNRLNRIEESAEIYRESAALPGGDPLALYDLSQGYWFAGRANEAEAAIEAAIAQKPFTGALLMDVWYKSSLRGDLAQARSLIEQIDPARMTEDRAAFFSYYTEMLGRNPGKAIAWLQAVPHDWLNDSWYRGPKGLLIGDADRLAGRAEAAAIEWQAALAQVQQQLVEHANDALLLRLDVLLLSALGRNEEAERQFSLYIQIVGIDPDQADVVPPGVIGCQIALGRKAEALHAMTNFVKKSPIWAVQYSSASLRLNPYYDSLRHEPEFARIIAEVEARERATAVPKAGLTTVASPEAADTWQARSADHILIYRPGLRERAAREIPAGRASNIPALLKAIERLKPIVAGHPGATRTGSPPLGEPATVYAPTDDELLLSLAGDRVWRSLQLMPPGTLDNMHQQNPEWEMEPVEYAHIEIVRADVAGSGPHVFALPPASRHLNFGAAAAPAKEKPSPP